MGLTLVLDGAVVSIVIAAILPQYVEKKKISRAVYLANTP
jgi:hypothetical protein